MIKKGFTLTEILITMMIIGVVAAVTLPSLNTSVNQRTIGPTLAKAFNTLESAYTNLLMQQKVRYITDKYNNVLEALASQISGEINDDGDVFYGDDGITYIVEKPTEPYTVEKAAAEQYAGRYFPMIIDVNGDNTPNKGGSDRFLVYVDLKGTIIPAGGSEAEKYGAKYNNIADKEIDCKNVSIGASEFCTATIMNDGWEYMY